MPDDELIERATQALDWAHPVRARMIIRELIVELQRYDIPLPDDVATAIETLKTDANCYRAQGDVSDAEEIEQIADLLERLQRRIEAMSVDRDTNEHQIREQQQRIVKLEKQNTFWACKRHKNQNTLRCAICDEQRIKELEDKIDELTELLKIVSCPF